MITLGDAKLKAEQKLVELVGATKASELTILEDRITETQRGWSLPYNTKRFLETGNVTDGLVGNGPLFVDRESGNVYVLPSAGFKRWIEAYDRTGIEPARNDLNSGLLAQKGKEPFPIPLPPKSGKPT